MSVLESPYGEVLLMASTCSSYTGGGRELAVFARFQTSHIMWEKC